MKVYVYVGIVALKILKILKKKNRLQSKIQQLMAC